MTKAIELSQLGSNITVNGSNIGIGTASPSSKLTIYDNVGGQSLLIEGAGGNDVAVLGSVNGATNRAEFLLKEGTTGGTRVRFTSQANTPSYILENNVGIGTDNPTGMLQVGSATGSHVIITENTGVDINDGAINLYQATSNANAVPFLISTDVGGTEIEKLRVTAGGKVGIGTVSPFCDLDLYYTGSGTSVASSGTTDTTTGARFGRGVVGIDFGILNNGTSYLQNRRIDNFATNYNFLINPNGGNVGIGTNNPAAKLHTQGTSVQVAGAFSDNITYGGRTFTTNHDIQATSMRGGVLVRNMNDFRSETSAASFMHYDAYTTTAKSYAFRAARGATLSDTFWVKSDGSMYAGNKLGVASTNPLYALDVRGESMSGLEYKAISSENGVLARECAGFGHANDNSSGCGVECILFQNLIQSNWVAFDLMIHASSCATTGAAHSSAWFFYRCRVYANAGFSFTQVDSGGDTGSINIAINDDGNVGTALGLTSNHARQFEVRMSRSGGQRSTLSVFVNSYPRIARFRRQP